MSNSKGLESAYEIVCKERDSLKSQLEEKVKELSDTRQLFYEVVGQRNTFMAELKKRDREIVEMRKVISGAQVLIQELKTPTKSEG